VEDKGLDFEQEIVNYCIKLVLEKSWRIIFDLKLKLFYLNIYHTFNRIWQIKMTCQKTKRKIPKILLLGDVSKMRALSTG
jgi:hypothetical protein